MLEGQYTDAYLAEAGRDAPKFTDDELKTIASPLDFVGINVYRPDRYVAPSDEAPGIAGSRSTRRTRRCIGVAHVRTRRPCTGHRGTSSRCGARRRSTSPRTVARRRMSSPTMAACTTPTGSCSCALPHPATAGDIRGCTGGRLLPLELTGQLRMERRIRQPVRHHLRRLRLPRSARPKLSANWFLEASRQNAVV